MKPVCVEDYRRLARRRLPRLLSDAAAFVNGAAWAVDGGALSTIRH